MLDVYRPRQVAGHRYLGDKRSGVVYDLDDVGSEGDVDSEEGSTPRSAIDELLASELYMCFAPDTLAEARNRGYRLYRRRAFREASRRIARLGRHTPSGGGAGRSSAKRAGRSAVGDAGGSAVGDASRSSGGGAGRSAVGDASRSSGGGAGRSALDKPVR